MRRMLRSHFETLAFIGRTRWRTPMTPLEGARAFTEIASTLCTANGVRVSVQGRPPDSPALLVAERGLWVDSLVVGSQTPCLPLAWSELAGWPVVGLGARLIGVVFVDEASPASRVQALRGALRALRLGASVLTTAYGPRGLVGAARRYDVPVVPVAVSYRPAGPDLDVEVSFATQT